MQNSKCGMRVTALLLAFLLVHIVMALASSVIWVESSDQVIENGMLIVDKGHAENGYILACIEGKNDKYKLRISSGDMTYNYDLSVDDGFVPFPLQMGSGRYDCALYRNTGGNKYTQVGKLSLNVELIEEYNAFLCPNQYVSFTQETEAVIMADSLCAELTEDVDKVKAIRDFIVNGFTYDYVRAITQKKSYLSDVDECFEIRKGLCQDLSALTACMLRSQGIPTQLVIGYADNAYHAWNRVLIDGEYRRLDVTASLSGMSKDVVYSAERYY